jgi:segregation and condensation protein B
MSDESDSIDDVSSFEDIELAYREALKSIDEAEAQVGSALMELADDSSDESDAEDAAFVSIGDKLAEDLAAGPGTSAVADIVSNGTTRVSPRSVIEAALFVGGDVSLTARKLASLIGQDTDAGLAVRLIDQLNDDYATEKRPYEIRLHEGGFRLELRHDFADVQARVFGLGPREVRLSPEVLETLAFVAYNQPVTRSDLEQTSRSNAVTLVRQLLRLQLVEVERTGSRRTDIAYRTGQRFLDLFGLSDLSDLPQTDIFSFK